MIYLRLLFLVVIFSLPLTGKAQTFTSTQADSVSIVDIAVECDSTIVTIQDVDRKTYSWIDNTITDELTPSQLKDKVKAYLMTIEREVKATRQKMCTDEYNTKLGDL